MQLCIVCPFGCVLYASLMHVFHSFTCACLALRHAGPNPRSTSNSSGSFELHVTCYSFRKYLKLKLLESILTFSNVLQAAWNYTSQNLLRDSAIGARHISPTTLPSKQRN